MTLIIHTSPDRPTRQCGDCTLCCRLLPVRSLNKGAGERCKHQSHARGCKVYARLADGTLKFHKDGYTDHRGSFDYASVSTPERQPVSKFAILVLSDEYGAMIREAAPPMQ